jgi:hypothetical protein
MEAVMVAILSSTRRRVAMVDTLPNKDMVVIRHKDTVVDMHSSLLKEPAVVLGWQVAQHLDLVVG